MEAKTVTEIPATVATVSLEDSRSFLSHGAEVLHTPVHPHPLLTLPSPGQIATKWDPLGWTPTPLLQLEDFPFLCVLLFLLDGPWHSSWDPRRQRGLPRDHTLDATA